MKALLLRIRAAYRRLPAAIRSGWVTAWVTFTGTLIALGTSLLPTLATAITTRDFDPFLDSLALSTQAAFSALLALGAGIVNTLYRFWRPVERAYVTDEAIEAKIRELAPYAPGNHPGAHIRDDRPPRL